MVNETDLELGGGRRLHFYDTGADDAEDRLAVFWHHGTPEPRRATRAPAAGRGGAGHALGVL